MENTNDDDVVPKRRDVGALGRVAGTPVLELMARELRLRCSVANVSPTEAKPTGTFARQYRKRVSQPNVSGLAAEPPS
jgi:hypothetical protein